MNSNPPDFRPVLDGRVKPWTYERTPAEWAKTARSPVFTYYWEHVPPTATGPNTRGAYHGSEINCVFDSLSLYATNPPRTDADRTVADTPSDE